MLLMKRPNTASRNKAVARSLGIKPLGSDFSWALLTRLCDDLDGSLSDEFRTALRACIRARSVTAYYSLEQQFGLHSIARLEYGPQAAAQRLLTALMRKNENLELKPDNVRKKECLAGVIQLDASLDAPIIRGSGDEVFVQTKYHVRRILGSAPTWDEVSERASHGPGSTATTPYEARSSYFKYSSWPYAVGKKARSLFIHCLRSDPRWLGALEHEYRTAEKIPMWRILNQDVFINDLVKEVNYNVITDVPKDGTKNRPIAKEPLGNVYLQLGIGKIIKSRLLVAGVNLYSQERNRALAKQASMDDGPLSPCTFDLSNASDTIHRDLVRELVSQEWFELLDSVRSPYGLLPDGTGWRYAKMSSMGNATTFELESLIFYSLLLAISDVFGDRSDRRHINVFGDDLIFPRYLARHAEVYLEAFGFRVNRDKSFKYGRFFESCGTDWLAGVDIRPVFLQRNPTSISEVLSIRNRLRRWWVVHMGCNLSRSLDNFFAKYIRGPLHLLEGPDSDTEFDSYWHSELSAGAERTSWLAISPVAVRIPAGSLWMRKLMHDLRCCTSSEGGRFAVTEVDQERWTVVSRNAYQPGYRVGGVLQTHVRPDWDRGFLPPPQSSAS